MKTLNKQTTKSLKILTLSCVQNLTPSIAQIKLLFQRYKITQVKIMESSPEIDVVNSSRFELLTSPLNITIQQNVNEDNNSSSQIQEPMETIPVEQIHQINAKSQKNIQILQLINFLWNLALVLLS